MRGTNEASGDKNQDQDQFGPGNLFSHEEDKYPFISHLNELLALMSTKTMKNLLTTQQKNVAEAFWSSCNYGGRPKPGDLKHMEDKRIYYEWVIRLDHIRQWDEKRKNLGDKQQKNVMLREDCVTKPDAGN